MVGDATGLKFVRLKLMTSEVYQVSSGERRRTGFVRSILLGLRTNSRLMLMLARRDIISQHRKSILGSLWIGLFPLLNVMVWVVLHSTGTFKPGDTGIPYPAFVLLGMSIWLFFIGYYQAMNGIFRKQAKMFLQIKVAPEVIIGYLVLVQSFSVAVFWIIAVIATLLYGVTIQPTTLLFPLVVLPLALMGTGTGLILSIMRVVAPDAFKILDRLVELLLYASPVLYGASIESGLLQEVLRLNPLTYLIFSARDVILTGSLLHAKAYAVCSAVSVVFFLLALRFYYIGYPRMLERVAV